MASHSRIGWILRVTPILLAIFTSVYTEACVYLCCAYIEMKQVSSERNNNYGFS